MGPRYLASPHGEKPWVMGNSHVFKKERHVFLGKCLVEILPMLVGIEWEMIVGISWGKALEITGGKKKAGKSIAKF